MYQFESRVRYSEVNSEMKMTLPSLLDYLQDCCTFQSEELGIGVAYLAKEHVAWVLSSWEIDIFRYPTMGEKISVHTWPYDFKGFYGYRNFRIVNEQGEVLVCANSVWVFMDTDKMRPARITDELVAIYQDELENPLQGQWSARKIALPDDMETKEPVPVAKYFIDTNHHMNNSKYVLVAREYLPEGFLPGRLNVEYKKAAVLGDVLYPSVAVEQDEVIVSLADEVGKPYAVVRFVRQ